MSQQMVLIRLDYLSGLLHSQQAASHEGVLGAVPVEVEADPDRRTCSRLKRGMSLNFLWRSRAAQAAAALG